MPPSQMKLIEVHSCCAETILTIKHIPQSQKPLLLQRKPEVNTDKFTVSQTSEKLTKISVDRISKKHL